LKYVVKSHVETTYGQKNAGIKVVAFCSDTYLDAAAKVGKALAESSNKSDIGVLVCGT
jgi:ribose 5-phosphate isomerase RpiB